MSLDFCLRSTFVTTQWMKDHSSSYVRHIYNLFSFKFDGRSLLLVKLRVSIEAQTFQKLYNVLTSQPIWGICAVIGRATLQLRQHKNHFCSATSQSVILREISLNTAMCALVPFYNVSLIFSEWHSIFGQQREVLGPTWEEITEEWR